MAGTQLVVPEMFAPAPAKAKTDFVGHALMPTEAYPKPRALKSLEDLTLNGEPQRNATLSVKCPVFIHDETAAITPRFKIVEMISYLELVAKNTGATLITFDCWGDLPK